MEILGIDIGGSGIKGAPVDVETGTLVQERYRLDTPQPSRPHAVAEVVAEIVHHFEWTGPVGCTFPGVVKKGVIYTTANVDDRWQHINGEDLLGEATNCPVLMINDGDAAGLAEVMFGAGQGHSGVVFVLTFGTGIGSAVFVDGHLFPNTELGHLEIRGKDAEHRAADRIRKLKGWDWDQWSKRVSEYLQRLEFYFSPDLFIIGGGVSKRYEEFLHLLKTEAPVVPAQLLNDAGIVGAALLARKLVMA